MSRRRAAAPRIEPARLGDVDAIAALLIADEESHFGSSGLDADALRAELRDPRFDLERNAWLVRGRGGLVAYAECGAVASDRLEVVAAFLPGAPRDSLDALVALADARARERDPAARRECGAADGDEALAAALTRGGYAPVRRYLHMGRDLRPGVSEPRDERIVPATVVDEREFHAAMEGALRDEWGRRALSFEEFSTRYAEMPRDAWVGAISGRRVAGIVIAAERAGRGWIFEVGVIPEFRRRGLGLALLRASFARLAEGGFGDVELNVDADNPTGAVNLYLRAGMRVRRSWVIWHAGGQEPPAPGSNFSS